MKVFLMKVFLLIESEPIPENPEYESTGICGVYATKISAEIALDIEKKRNLQEWLEDDPENTEKKILQQWEREGPTWTIDERSVQ
jgi:hypothetical protein